MELPVLVRGIYVFGHAGHLTRAGKMNKPLLYYQSCTQAPYKAFESSLFVYSRI